MTVWRWQPTQLNRRAVTSIGAERADEGWIYTVAGETLQTAERLLGSGHSVGLDRQILGWRCAFLFGLFLIPKITRSVTAFLPILCPVYIGLSASRTYIAYPSSAANSRASTSAHTLCRRTGLQAVQHHTKAWFSLVGARMICSRRGFSASCRALTNRVPGTNSFARIDSCGLQKRGSVGLRLSHRRTLSDRLTSRSRSESP